MSKINIVVPMAGLGSRFAVAGYEKYKPFIDVAGKPMIERVILNLMIPDARFILIGRTEHLASDRLTINRLQEEYDVEFLFLQKTTEGTASTVLHARELINNESPLIIANSDQIVDHSIWNFYCDCKSRGLDGSIMCFEDSELNPKWSFAKIDSITNHVIEVQEKVPISKYATVGIYLYMKGHYFVDSAIDMIINNDRVNNEFYTCPVYNYCIKRNLKIGAYMVSKDDMHGIGTPEDLSKYLESTR